MLHTMLYCIHQSRNFVLLYISLSSSFADISKVGLDIGQLNFSRNQISPHSNHEFVVADTFDYLDWCVAKKKQFDIVLSDPPTLFNTSNTSQIRSTGRKISCNKDYDAIVASAMRAVSPHGYLVLFSNSHSCKLDKWQRMVESALIKSPHKFNKISYLQAADDFFEDKTEPDRKSVV